MSGVGERLVEFGTIFALFGFKNHSTIKALDVLNIVVLGDEAGAGVLAGGVVHGRTPNGV